MFCKECKTLMYPKEDMFICPKCGLKKKKNKRIQIISHQLETEEIEVYNDNPIKKKMEEIDEEIDGYFFKKHENKDKKEEIDEE